MIINTGQRTDIPAFYSEWFFNRIKEGYVYVRNPYYPSIINNYILDPKVVDCLCFCTKNPKPMLSRLDEIQAYRQFWFVTITPYSKDVELHVPAVNDVIISFRELSQIVGKKAIAWRYDPIFINQKYTIQYHIQAFEYIARALSNFTHRCVISFIDLYQKTKKNFPNIKEVPLETQHYLAKEFSNIAKKYGIQIFTCVESQDLKQYGIDCDGCMTQKVLENALDIHLNLPKNHVREGCTCVLGNDIGAYNTCLHGCLYCYANEDKYKVFQHYQHHDPLSPLLVGYVKEQDIIKNPRQISYLDLQLSLNI